MDFEKMMNDVNSKKMNRKSFLEVTGKTAAATAFGLILPNINPHHVGAETTTTFKSYPFTLGIASGDPHPDGVVLWTRIAPNPLAEDGSGGMEKRYVPVQWEVAKDEKFHHIVREGTEVAGPELGHSIHAEVHGLKPGKEYYYRFKAGEEVSPVGKTKTAPNQDAHLNKLSFAIASCQSWTGGRYAAYKNMVEEDLDFVLHLGDYTYEGRDTETIADFRINHAKYKTSPDLQAAHAKFPFIVTFDDHEIENNWADEVSQEDHEASNERERFLQLRANAFQAYYEHLPLRRRSKPHGYEMLLYRKLTFGDLAEFSVMDTRQYRDDQVGNGFPAGPLDPAASDPSRTMVGSEQGYWLLKNLHHSRTKWNILAQQTIMAQFDYDTGEGISVNHDQWDGYSADRNRLLTFIKERRPSNPVVLSGDWHSSWVNDLKEDFNDLKSATLATEFVGTSISSGCGWRDDVEAALSVNPHVKFFNGDYRGYVVCNVTQKSWQSDYRVVSSASNPDVKASTLASFIVKNGNAGAMRMGGVDITEISADTMIAGKPNPVSVTLSNGTERPVTVKVDVTVPEGWKSEKVVRVLPPSSTSTVEIPVTPPSNKPAAEKLRVEVKAAGTTVFSRPTDLNAVSVIAAEDLHLAFDSGAKSSPTFAGFTKLSPEDTWKTGKGYGWVGTVPTSRDRRKRDALLGDFTLYRNKPITLRLTVPAGIHQVYFLTGDASYGSGNTIIHSGGKLLAESGKELSPGQFKWVPFELDGGSTGREIDLEITGALRDGWWRLNALIMLP